MRSGSYLPTDHPICVAHTARKLSGHPSCDIFVISPSAEESCSCSYGLTTIEGCEADECASTGGSTLSIPDSIYEAKEYEKCVKFVGQAVITYSTVGFGDYSPKSFPGRVVGAFLMVFGVLAFGNLVPFPQWTESDRVCLRLRALRL